MSQYSIREFIQEAHQQITFLENHKKKLSELREDYNHKISDLNLRYKELLNQITQILFPDFSEKSLHSLSERIGNPSLLSLLAQKEREKNTLQSTISTIDSDSKFVQRDAFLHSTTGIFAQQEAEISPLFSKAKSIVTTCESIQRFGGLLQRGYGTSSYPHQGILRFINSEFLQDWKYADIICEKLQVPSFIDALSLYRESKDRYLTLGESLQELEKEKSSLLSMVETYDKAQQDLRNIDARYYERIQLSIEIFLTSNSKQKIATTIQNDTILMEQYAYFDGIKHQIEYVSQLKEKIGSDIRQIDEKIHNLTIEKQRYENDMYRFRNKRWSAEQFSRKFNRNQDAYDNRLHKYQRTGDTIYSFNDYNRPSFVEEFLWWDIMTDGRLDGNFIPDVHEYYASHPDFHYERNSSYPTDYGDNS